MNCVCIFRHGGPEVLACCEAPRPRCASDELLIEVHAAGVNPVDWKIREGQLRGVLEHTFPLILGWDLSGTVCAVGSTTSRFRIGDEIFSRPDLRRDGAYAQYIAIKESDAALKPRSMDHRHAAALPFAGLAAWQSLVAVAALGPGQRALIHAAAGGVGSLAVQLAKARGAYVIATTSARNHNFVRDLGADEIIDYTTMRFEELAPDMDVVLDTIGGDTQTRSWKTLRRGGILVSLTSPPSTEVAAQHGVRSAFVVVESNAAHLAELAVLAEAGKVKPVLGSVLPLAEARRAHALSQGGHTRGKIVLELI